MKNLHPALRPLLVVAFWLLAGEARAGPYDTWSRYKTLTLNTTSSGGGASVSSTLTDYTVLVRLTTANADDILDEALANGADVRFASSDGSTALSFEIERWSSTAAEIWVLVPSVAGNSTTDIRIYWGKSGQSTASSGTAAFATSESYEAAWHLNETGNSNADGYKDATGNAAHAQGTNFGGGNEATAAVGRGQTFAAASSRKITPKAGAETNFDITSAITVSAWINVNSWTVAWQAIITKGEGAWRLARNNGAGNLNFHCVGLATNTNITGSTTLTTGGSTWYNVVGVYDGSFLRLYLNGATDAAALTATGSIATTNDNVVIGENGGATGRYFNGIMDEVRVESVARSADWIKMNYQSQKPGATCVVFGPTVATTYYWHRNSVLTANGAIHRAYNWTLHADGTGRRPASGADDAFTSTSIGGSWTCQDSDNEATSGTCSASTNRGSLTLNGRGADVFGANNQFTALRRSDILGDFDVVVKVTSLTAVTVNSKACLYMADNFASLGSGGYAGLCLRGDGKAEFQADVSGNVGEIETWTQSGVLITPSGGEVEGAVWLRLVKDGSSVSAFYRTSQSSAWTQQGTTLTIQSTADDSQIALLHTAQSTATAGSAVFDEFQAGGELTATDLDLSFAGTGSNADGTAYLWYGQSAASVDFTGFTGWLDFDANTLTINSGNATFVSGMSVAVGTGTLAFTGTSGTQVLTPASGVSLPNITHTGASTLQLSTNTLSCVSFSQSAGVLDFNSEDITTTGDFTLSNGTTSSLTNLNGRTLTVGGDASLAGQSGNLLNLNAAAWTLTVSGSLTAQYAYVAGSDASGGTQGIPTACTDGGNNSNWLFTIPVTRSNLSRSVLINFNTTASATLVSSNVTNIPILVRFTSANLTFSATTESGVDLLFIDKDGSTLYHEVSEWDKAHQTGKVWVKVPQVDGNSTTDFITAMYGCDSCTSNAYASSATVFNGFQGVFHLNAPEEKAYDAATLANHGAYGRNLPIATGITGKGATYFDGTSTSLINVPNETNYDITTNLSVWAWVKATSLSTAWQAIVTKGDDSWRLVRNNATNNLTFTCEKTAVDYATNGSVNVNDGAWHHVVGTYDGANVKLYVDGVQDGSSTALTGSVTNSAANVHIGENAGATGRNWNGPISEVRIGNAAAALSADFIKLSYLNQKENSALFTFFTAASFSSSKVFKFNTTASGANITTDVSDFPLLLRITGSTILDAVRPGAPDIRFLDGDGVTWLPYSIERWDNGSKDSAEVWVKVPKIDGNSSGDFITMYYNDVVNDAVPDAQCATCVFDGANLHAVYHMNDNAASATVAEARNVHTGTLKRIGASRNTSNNVGAGYIGASSLTFSGTDEFVDLGGSSALAQNKSGMTLSAWVQTSNTNSNKRDIVFFAKNGDLASSRSKLFLYTTNYVAGGGRALDGEASPTEETATSAALAINTWAHVACVIDYQADAVRVYVNGVRVDDKSAAGFTAQQTSNTSGGASIGAAANGTTEEWTGLIDEVQISSTVLDTNWVKLAYQSQRRDAALLFNPSLAEFTSSRKLVFNTTQSGANVMTDQENFPLLVRITGSTIVDAVQNDWDDIRFLDADGKTWLNYAVERWSKTQDSAEVWVMVPKVDGNSDQDFITLYYNDATDGAVPDGQCASCVFSSTNSFVAAWNLNTSGTGARANSVSGGNSATPVNYDNDEFKGGAIAGADSLDGAATGDHLTLGSGYANFTGGITLSIWAYPASTANFARFFDIANGAANNNIWFGRNATSTTLSFEAYNGASSGGYVNATGALATGSWQHFVATMDASNNVRIYKNGSVIGTGTSTQSVGNTSRSSTYIGRSNWADAYYQGKIDQPQILNAAMDSNWVRLQYETQRPTGSLFWTVGPGPNNKAVLTATPGSSGISLAWSSTVTDSANADSIGIWVKYSGSPVSVGTAGQTKVAVVPIGDSAYTYPATYSMTYYFALAVRNSSGQWSPFTAASTDTVLQTGSTSLTDTIYVDSAIGSASYTCTQAQNPSTPKATLEDADGCDAGTVTDTLVIRVMPGTYSGANNDQFDSNVKPVVVTSFDANSRAVFVGSSTSVSYSSVTYWPTVYLWGGTHLRNVDLMAGKTSVTTAVGVMTADEGNSTIEGCRIYNNGSTKHDYGILLSGNSDNFHVASNLVVQPNTYGIWADKANDFNIVNNTVIGTGAASSRGITMTQTASAADMTLANNIIYNWEYGLYTTSNTAAIGTVSNNLFYLVTSNRELTGSTDAAKVTRDPLFYDTTRSGRHAYKLLPGSPALDAGTTTMGSGYARTVVTDLWGTARPQGSGRDIGAYEGTGYTPNPAGEFDTLTNSTSGNTVTVENAKFKLVWDMARGGGITGFYDKTGNPATNLVGTNSLLFDVRLDTYIASTQTSNAIAPSFVERTRARSVVRQRLALSASLDLNVYYTVYPSGHVYVQSEITNLGTITLDLDVVQYGVKVGAADAVTKSAGTSSGLSFRSGYGYLNLATRDVFLSATAKLDGDSVFSEVWSQTASVAGSLDSVSFQTSDLADPIKNMSRHHHFLIYLGDAALDAKKAAALNADAFAPSPVSMSAGSLLHERSWQDAIAGHWPLDDGKGTIAKDVSLLNTNNTSTLTSVSWVSGKVNGALRFTTASVGIVSDNAALEARKGFSVSFWFKPDFSAMGSTGFILSKGITTTNGWYFRRNSAASTIRFNVDGASTDSPVLTTGLWYHIAGVVGSSGQLYLYVNGVLVSASTGNATTVVNADALRLGEDATGTAADAYAGDLDEVRIYHTGLGVAAVQALSNRGFATKHGHYHLRADNNNRVVALLNESAAATRVQPAFEIDNWYGTKTPKYVYLNGVRLTPNVDYAVDSVVYNGDGAYGSSLYLQLNQVLTGADQTLFVDDNDSSGYLGEAAKMKSLTIAATASDKIAIQNFSGTTFGSATSGQWAVELDLNGWTTPTVNAMNDVGFGEFNSWKAAAISPVVAVSSATELTGRDAEAGRNLSHMKFDDVGSNEIYGSGEGYLGPTNLTYTLTDSSATRISLLLSDISLSGAGTATLKKRFTVYPNGRIFSSFELSATTIAMDEPRIDCQGRYSASAVETWAEATTETTGRHGMMAGDADFHSFACAVLSVKSAGATTSAAATYMNSLTSSVVLSDATNSHSRNRLYLAPALSEVNDDPVTFNYVMDISRDFTDAATADSLMKDIQTPAVITAITGTANPADALDFAASPDGFAEGDGAYVYTSSSGIAHFKLVNTVAHFSPAFRIKSWAVASLPEYVTVDNQTLVKDYHYNAYVNTASDELIIQFNKTFQPATHVFYISHKTGLAVTLNRFEAVPGEGVDTLKWTTESEFENLGFNLWRRLAHVQAAPGAEAVAYQDLSGMQGVNGRLLAARVKPASPASVSKAAGGTADDTLPSHAYTADELQAQGYVRLTAQLIAGAPGGSSASTREYTFVDRSAAFGMTYEYLLEAVDFHGAKVQYGPRAATPLNPLETALLPNYPNPFNPVTTLRFSLKEQGKVSLLLYDARGRLVRSLIRPDKALAPGKYRLLWDARDESGMEVPSGQYFYRFTTGRFSKTRKMLLVK